MIISTTKEKSPRKSKTKFPKLIIDKFGDNLIILVTGPGKKSIDLKGFVIHGGSENDYEIGEFSNEWNATLFKDYNDKVILENE